MRKRSFWFSAMALASGALVCTGTRQTVRAADSAGPPPLSTWKNGPSADPHFFPIAVWLQEPSRAAKFEAIGINTYVGLWEGPTEKQLADLKAAGMRVFCEQNAVALKHVDDPTIAGWMHGDEPDNAQALPGGRGYGDPVPPAKIIADYQRIKSLDPTRPVMLNLGQGVANDDWKGRGNHPQDYYEYCKGADILSFDVYPVAGIDRPDGENFLWYVPRGLDRLKEYCGDSKIRWNALECTHIGDANRKAIPEQVKAEVWMSLIHGSHGIIYFIHQFKPRFIEAALLEDPEMTAAVSAINHQIQELAPALNSPTVSDAILGIIPDNSLPIDMMVKRRGGVTYLFAVGMRNGAAHGQFTVLSKQQPGQVTVIGENRTIAVKKGSFGDDFKPYAVHLYRWGAAK